MTPEEQTALDAIEEAVNRVLDKYIGKVNITPATLAALEASIFHAVTPYFPEAAGEIKFSTCSRPSEVVPANLYTAALMVACQMGLRMPDPRVMENGTFILKNRDGHDAVQVNSVFDGVVNVVHLPLPDDPGTFSIRFTIGSLEQPKDTSP